MLNVTALSREYRDVDSGKRRYMIGGANSLQASGVAVGACLVVGRCAVGKVSGGLLNPALALALGAGPEASRAALYCAFEVAGATLAALLFVALRGKGGPLQLEDAKNTNYG